MLTALNPIIKIKPLISKINPKIIINLPGKRLRIPNSQKHTAIKTSKNPKSFTSIDFLKADSLKIYAPVAQPGFRAAAS